MQLSEKSLKYLILGIGVAGAGIAFAIAAFTAFGSGTPGSQSSGGTGTGSGQTGGTGGGTGTTGGGSGCSSDGDCGSCSVCINGNCSSYGTPCTSDSGCTNCESCINGCCGSRIPNSITALDSISNLSVQEYVASETVDVWPLPSYTWCQWNTLSMNSDLTTDYTQPTWQCRFQVTDANGYAVPCIDLQFYSDYSSIVFVSTDSVSTDSNGIATCVFGFNGPQQLGASCPIAGTAVSELVTFNLYATMIGTSQKIEVPGAIKVVINGITPPLKL